MFNILRWAGLIFLCALIIGEVISVSIVAQTLFSGNFGKVIVGIMLIAYVLFFSFTSSLMAFWVSFWDLAKKVKILILIMILFGFSGSLALIPLAVNAKESGIFLIIPLLLYSAAFYRLGKGIYTQ